MIKHGDLVVVARQYASETPRPYLAPLLRKLADELERVRELYRNSATTFGVRQDLINEMLYPGSMQKKDDKDVLQPDARVPTSGAASD